MDQDESLSEAKPLSVEEEEIIETLEQKIKIAKRKGRDSKVQSLTEKVKALRGRENPEKMGLEERLLYLLPLFLFFSFSFSLSLFSFSLLKMK